MDPINQAICRRALALARKGATEAQAQRQLLQEGMDVAFAQLVAWFVAARLRPLA